MNKHKPIRSVDELVGGQYYIRAWVNDDGCCFTEVFRLAGKPFADASGFFKGSLRVNTRRGSIEGGDWNYEYYLTDMGAFATHPCVRLYRFTPELMNKFEKASKSFDQFNALMDSPGDTLHDRLRRNQCREAFGSKIDDYYL